MKEGPVGHGLWVNPKYTHRVIRVILSDSKPGFLTGEEDACVSPCRPKAAIIRYKSSPQGEARKEKRERKKITKEERKKRRPEFLFGRKGKKRETEKNYGFPSSLPSASTLY